MKLGFKLQLKRNPNPCRHGVHNYSTQIFLSQSSKILGGGQGRKKEAQIEKYLKMQ